MGLREDVPLLPIAQHFLGLEDVGAVKLSDNVVERDRVMVQD
ncbi:hypothetical protein LCGC14_0532530 [marine sediment metagenome]|uniref:Uncharacterized protein n=1 Tax=marine sediment metagenome TaxID=412755 RepID=A0A0F9S015_9ZZZZ